MTAGRVISSLELDLQLFEAARDAAGDRARAGARAHRRSSGSSRRGQKKRSRISRQSRRACASASCTVSASSSRASVSSSSPPPSSASDRLLAAPSAQPVDARAPRQLGEPRPDRLVVPQLGEMLVDAGEDLLEDVLGVVLATAGSPARRSRRRSGRSARRALPRPTLPLVGSARRAGLQGGWRAVHDISSSGKVGGGRCPPSARTGGVPATPP